MCVVVAEQVAGVQHRLRDQNRRGCWGYLLQRWVGMVGIVGVGGRFAVVGPEAVEIAVVGGQGQGRRFRVWVVPGHGVVPGPEVEIVPELEAVPGLEAVLEPELSDLAEQVRWRGLA
jgi:hypothetical protein